MILFTEEVDARAGPDEHNESGARFSNANTLETRT